MFLSNSVDMMKNLSGNSGAMRLKGFEKIISKSINKAKYRHPSKCKAEILSTVKIYRGLSPQFERFVFDNGDIGVARDMFSRNFKICTNLRIISTKCYVIFVMICSKLRGKMPFLTNKEFVFFLN